MGACSLAHYNYISTSVHYKGKNLLIWQQHKLLRLSDKWVITFHPFRGRVNLSEKNLSASFMTTAIPLPFTLSSLQYKISDDPLPVCFTKSPMHLPRFRVAKHLCHQCPAAHPVPECKIVHSEGKHILHIQLKYAHSSLSITLAGTVDMPTFNKVVEISRKSNHCHCNQHGHGEMKLLCHFYFSQGNCYDICM